MGSSASIALALALLLATAAAPPAAAEPEGHLVAQLEAETLGPPMSQTQLRTELGGFNALLPPASPAIESQTSAIILWDDCCSSGRTPRGRATNGTVKATSSF